jgi:hypothetical protein
MDRPPRSGPIDLHRRGGKRVDSSAWENTNEGKAMRRIGIELRKHFSNVMIQIL